MIFSIVISIFAKIKCNFFVMEQNIQEIFARFPGSNKDNLIPILQEIQKKWGFLSEMDITLVSQYLKIPISKIYGVATFYNQFRFQPLGKYHIKLCGGTACHLSGTNQLVKTIEKALKIKPGERSHNNLFSCEIVDCMGACSLSPIISINDEYHTKVDQTKLTSIIDEIRKTISE